MSLGGGGTDNRELEVGVATPDRSLSIADTNMLMQKQTSKVINGVHTEVVLQPFADRVLILITQLGKVGNLVRGRKLLTAQTNTDSCEDTSIDTTNSTSTGTTIPRHGRAQRFHITSPSTINTTDAVARECTNRPPANIVYAIRITSRHNDLGRGGEWGDG